MKLEEFLRHNRWQKITALFLATLIWLTVDRKLRRGGGVRLSLGGATRQLTGLPIRMLSAEGVELRCELTPRVANVTLRGDAGALNRLQDQEVQVFVPLLKPAGGEYRERLQVVAPGFDLVEVSPKEVLIRSSVPSTNRP